MADAFERVPREFYPGISSIREAALEYNVPEIAVDEMLDLVEQEIMDCLSQRPEEEEDEEAEQ